MKLKNRFRLFLASLPAKLPTPITRNLEKVGANQVYQSIGDSIQDYAEVTVNVDNIEFKLFSDLGNPTREIQKSGCYEPTLTRKILEVLKEDDVFMDVGSSFGYFALLAAHITSPENVYAIEPNPKTRALLEKNCGSGNTSRLTVDPYLIGDETKQDLTKSLTVYSGLPAGESYEISITTNQYTIDDYCTMHGIQPNVIKVDIDGGEFKMVSGMEHTLKHYRPTVLLEIHPHLLDNSFDADSEAVLNPFFKKGYAAKYAAGYLNRDADWTSHRPQKNQAYMACLTHSENP